MSWGRLGRLVLRGLWVSLEWLALLVILAQLALLAYLAWLEWQDHPASWGR